jgi:hypothetical protein
VSRVRTPDGVPTKTLEIPTFPGFFISHGNCVKIPRFPSFFLVLWETLWETFFLMITENPAITAGLLALPGCPIRWSRIYHMIVQSNKKDRGLLPGSVFFLLL